MHRAIYILLATATAAALLAQPAQSASDPFEDARQLFQRAYAQAEAGTDGAVRDDSDALRTYPLYPYLQAARIRRLLLDTDANAEVVDKAAAEFTEYYDREPVGRDLRRSWLADLAQRRRWDVFLAQYRENLADDALRCQYFAARIDLGQTADLEPQIAKQWLTPRSLPQCEQAFEWLKAQQALTAPLIEQRVRAALKDGNAAFARQIAALLPVERSAPLLQWAALLENPARAIDAALAVPERAIEDEALLAGWTRLTRRERDLAVQRFDELVSKRKLSDAAASPYALALALSLAWDRRPEALQYFKHVAAADLDDYALEWQTRAALWAEDWALAARSIASMSDQQRKTSRWRYWTARATERSGDPKLARQLYESVLIDDNYYSAMAAARLDRPVAPHVEKLPLDKLQLTQIEQLPAMVRARELLLTGLRNFALAEWQHGYEALSEPARRQAIHLADSWDWHEQAIAVAAQQRVFNDYSLLYPRPFDSEVREAARLTGLRSELIYSVMRQESLYRADAVSSAGAIGLLQMLPETARRTAQRWKRPRPSNAELRQPAVNVPLGAAQLRTLLDRFGGQTAVALAGYNAGPNAAARWLPAQAVESDIWIENIPYNETRTYVQRILWHSIVFAWLRSGEPQRTDTWTARIAAPSDGAVVGMSEESRASPEGG